MSDYQIWDLWYNRGVGSRRLKSIDFGTPSMATTVGGVLVEVVMSRQTKEQKRAEYIKHKDKYLARAKEWSKNNPDKRKEILGRWNNKAKEYKRDWWQKKSFGNVIQLVECALCFSTEQLIVHHRDGNNGKLERPLNNDLNNLVVLCRSCHPKVHRNGVVKRLAT